MKWIPGQVKSETMSYFDYLFYIDKMRQEKPKNVNINKTNFGGK